MRHNTNIRSLYSRSAIIKWFLRSDPFTWCFLLQLLLKPFYIAYLIIGGRLGDPINNYFLDGSTVDVRRTTGAMSGVAASVAILGSAVAIMAKGRRKSA